MGLDMYLKVEKYVGGWEHGSAGERTLYSELLDATKLKELATSDSPSITIDVTCVYWRKANQIHNWFVQNVQNGVDECQRSYVEREQLVALRDVCREVLAQTKLSDGLVMNGSTIGEDGEFHPILEEGKMVVQSQVAEQLLPTSSGFFFGGTDYDEWYVRDVEHTVSELDRVLSATENMSVDFYYQASW